MQLGWQRWQDRLATPDMHLGSRTGLCCWGSEPDPQPALLWSHCYFKHTSCIRTSAPTSTQAGKSISQMLRGSSLRHMLNFQPMFKSHGNPWHKSFSELEPSGGREQAQEAWMWLFFIHSKTISSISSAWGGIPALVSASLRCTTLCAQTKQRCHEVAEHILKQWYV